jgi:hypothetical protein
LYACACEFSLHRESFNEILVGTHLSAMGVLHLPSHPVPSSHVVAPLTLVVSTSTWHRCLSHPGVGALPKLSHDSSVICSRRTHDLCHSCQLGHHTHMLFVSSDSRADNNFDLIHYDLWTSQNVSISCYKYYLVSIDDRSHFVWTSLLHVKYDTFFTLSNIFAYVSIQFGHTIKVV